MNEFLTNIFVKIAQKLGLTVQPKKVDNTDYFNTSGLSVTALLADRLATITLTDSTIEVTGNNKRAEWLNKFIDDFWSTRIKSACVTSLGTGDCLLKPNTDGQRVAVDIISNNNFAITENIGSYIYGMLIKCDEYWEGNNHFERLEYHRLRTENGATNCYIYQMAYRNGNEIALSQTQWSEFAEEMIIPNVDRLLLGRIKCPIVNRENVNNPNGVPITYGLDDVVLEAKASYERFNKEFNDKETMLFADKSMFKRDKDGNPTIPRGKGNMFMTFRGDTVDGAKKIDTFSPDIRDASLDNGIERNLRMLELGCGLGEGVLSKSTLTYTNVDEVRASRSATYAFMTDFRKAIDQGTEDLIYAVNVLANANNITPMGDYEYVPDWSDAYMETSRNRFNQLLQSESIGAVSKAEVRSWTMNEDLDVSEEKVQEIDASNPSFVENNSNPDLFE